ncbi:MAG: VOC family protein [Aeromonadales bacterium]|nr:VOC family protein [Aeromonadales bacterium]
MPELNSLLGNVDEFVTRLASGLKQAGLPVTLGEMDHICYRAASKSEYLEKRDSLARFGLTLVEGMIGGRPIITFSLYAPLPSPFGPIRCIELAAPKSGRAHFTGLEHGEIVVPSVAQLLDDYPNVPFNSKGLNAAPPEISLSLAPYQVKFHEQSLAKTIADELANDLVEWVPKDYFDSL